MNDPSWATRNNLASKLDEFRSVYESRPIKDNRGGMLSTHMFYTWLTAKTLNPQLIIDSGTFKGQSAWLFKQACPAAEVLSFDVDTSQREITCRDVEYLDGDFSEFNWCNAPESSLAFFDDHQNAYKRLQQCSWFGLRHLMFEDNYPAQQGDCYSPKKIFSCSGFRDNEDNRNSIINTGRTQKLIQKIAKKIIGNQPISESQMSQFDSIKIKKNNWDKTMLERKLEEYIEFPPIYKCDTTRWGDAWDSSYPTHEPLIKTLSTEEAKDSTDIYANECQFYTWICYCKLR